MYHLLNIPPFPNKLATCHLTVVDSPSKPSLYIEHEGKKGQMTQGQLIEIKERAVLVHVWLMSPIFSFSPIKRKNEE